MILRHCTPKALRKAVRSAREARALDEALKERDGPAWRRCPPCDVGLYDAAHAHVGKLMYVFGGYHALDTVSDRIRVFDLEAETWLPSLPAPQGLPQSHSAVATDGERYVYYASGQLGAQCSPAIRDVFAFDTQTGQWCNLPPLPAARYAGTMQLWRGRLHFVGGAREDRWTPSDDHWSLGVRNGVVTEEVWRPQAPIPLPGMHRGSIIYKDALYVFGGQQGDFVAIKGHPACKCTGRTQETYLSGCFRLDNPAGDWIALADLPIPVSHTDFAVVEVAGQILLVGGQIYKDPVKFYLRLTDAVQAYDVEGDRWCIAGHLPYRLKIPLVTAWNETLYLIGGQRGVGLGDFPGAVTKDVWAAPLSGLRKHTDAPLSDVFAGKSILMLSHALSHSGAPLLLVETAQRLVQAGATVRLASLGEDTAGHSIAARMGVPIIPVETAARHAGSGDIVIANTVTREVMQWVSDALREDPGIASKLVSWVHEIDVEHFMPAGETLKRASMTIFDSQACLDAWVEALGPLRKSSVIHPYANSAFAEVISNERLPFPRNPRSRRSSEVTLSSRREIRQWLGVSDGDFLVLNLATVEERKGQKLLLRALSHLATERDLPVKLLLVGFRNWRQRLKFLLRLNARERAVLTPARAYVWQTEIAAFYRAADAFVINTQGIGALRGECFGRVTVEAMSSGLVALGTAAGGTTEIIVDGETGLLFPPGVEGQEDLIDRIEELVRDPKRAAALGRAGQAIVAARFSEARFFRDFEDCFR